MPRRFGSLCLAAVGVRVASPSRQIEALRNAYTMLSDVMVEEVGKSVYVVTAPGACVWVASCSHAGGPPRRVVRWILRGRLVAVRVPRAAVAAGVADQGARLLCVVVVHERRARAAAPSFVCMLAVERACGGACVKHRQRRNGAAARLCRSWRSRTLPATARARR